MSRLCLAAVAVAALLCGCGDRAGGRAPAADAAAAVADGPAAGGVGTGTPAMRAAAPWPAFGHDAAHTGAAPVDGPRRGRVRWRVRLEGPVVPGPVVGRGGIVYAASNGGVLHALGVRDGRERWRLDGGAPYGSDLSTVPLLTPGGLLLWPGPGDTLFGVRARDGRLLWRVALAGEGRSPALAPDGTVVIGDAAGTVRALRLRGGRPPQVLWTADTGDVSYASPAIAPDGTVYTTVDRELVALRGGRVRWRVAAGDISEVSPAVGPDGTVVFGANDDTVTAVAPDGTIRWRRALGALTYSSPAATRDGLVYVGDHRGRVRALGIADGRARLQVTGLGRSAKLRSVGVWTQPVVDAHHRVYFGTRPGHVYGFAADGTRLFDVATGATVDSYPALAGDGTLLVGSESGELLAIG